jgi:hypothetical protein
VHVSTELTRAQAAALHDIAILRAYIDGLRSVFEPESAGALMLSSMDAAACAVGFLLDPAWEWGRADVPPSPLMQEGT